MGHSIRAILGPYEAVRVLAGGWDFAEAVRLPQGFGMVFLTDALLDGIAEQRRLSGGPLYPGLFYLTAAADQFLRQSSLHTRLAYVETDYFGGAGTQAGVLYQNGQAAFHGGEGAVNRLLRELGVRRGFRRDEFDSLGLESYRRMED